MNKSFRSTIEGHKRTEILSEDTMIDKVQDSKMFPWVRWLCQRDQIINKWPTLKKANQDQSELQKLQMPLPTRTRSTSLTLSRAFTKSKEDKNRQRQRHEARVHHEACKWEVRTYKQWRKISLLFNILINVIQVNKNEGWLIDIITFKKYFNIN